MLNNVNLKLSIQKMNGRREADAGMRTNDLQNKDENNNIALTSHENKNCDCRTGFKNIYTCIV